MVPKAWDRRARFFWGAGGPFGGLSNSYRSSFIDPSSAIKYFCSEQYVMHQKALLVGDTIANKAFMLFWRSVEANFAVGLLPRWICLHDGTAPPATADASAAIPASPIPQPKRRAGAPPGLASRPPGGPKPRPPRPGRW